MRSIRPNRFVLQIAQKSCGLAVSDLDFCGSSNLDLTGQLWKILRIDFVANDARRSFRAIERVCCWAFADIKTGTFMQAMRSTAGSGQRKPWALLRPRSSKEPHTTVVRFAHSLYHGTARYYAPHFTTLPHARRKTSSSFFH